VGILKQSENIKTDLRKIIKVTGENC